MERVVLRRCQDRTFVLPKIHTSFHATRVDPERQSRGVAIPKLPSSPGVEYLLAVCVQEFDMLEDIAAFSHGLREVNVEFEVVRREPVARWVNRLDGRRIGTVDDGSTVQASRSRATVSAQGRKVALAGDEAKTGREY